MIHFSLFYFKTKTKLKYRTVLISLFKTPKIIEYKTFLYIDNDLDHI